MLLKQNSLQKKIALGTAQFGSCYGIANASGKISLEEGKKILEDAYCHGIKTLDTAIRYGESEFMLGKIGVGRFNVITKLPSLPHDCKDVKAWLYQQVEASLSLLGLNVIYGVLLHSTEDLFGKNANYIISILREMQLTGVIKKIGISVYSIKDYASCKAVFLPEIIQIPLNILDGRISRSDLQDIKRGGTEIHVRSIFLQGLLLMDLNKIPQKFYPWKNKLLDFHDWVATTGNSSLEVCINYIASIPEIDYLVLGVDSSHHLNEILRVRQFDVDLPKSLQIVDDRLLNPMLWSSL
jgi:hypothetical protein